jgi:cytochrome o ubiquinol oxidase subunit 2
MIKEQYFGYLKRLCWLPMLMLGGCKWTLMDPKGQIGADEKSLIITLTLLMLIVVIPAIAMTLFFAWKYRATNRRATYAPEWSHSGRIELAVWSIPLILLVILGWLTWDSSHKLDPYRPLDSAVKPVEIQVVSLDWKWLFIYPEQGIATVNEVVFPKDTPVNFKITSQGTMNSFFIPQLGSQIYAMAGMQTKLHLIANEEGVFDGMSANYSGGGFSGMKFKAKATSNEGFDAWVAQVKAAPQSLELANYPALAAPSEADPVQYFATVSPELYPHILNQYGHSHAPVATPHASADDAEQSAAAPAHDMHEMQGQMHMSSEE